MMDSVRIFVEPVDDHYAVVLWVNEQPWKRLGPFDNLNDANAVCTRLLERAQAIANRYKQ